MPRKTAGSSESTTTTPGGFNEAAARCRGKLTEEGYALACAAWLQ